MQFSILTLSLIRRFLKLLKKQEDEVTVFSDGLWTGLLDYTTVYADGRMTFKNTRPSTADLKQKKSSRSTVLHR